MVAIADEVTEEPQPVRFFGQDMALYRGKSGRVVLLNAYCPHIVNIGPQHDLLCRALDGTRIEGASHPLPRPWLALHAW